ncbi:MAG: hypothetical protein CMH46_07830 [Muricauda sp.]|nr:helix-turn-helix domain-containing protein [Allomuricauda sp.]MAU15434.1 hypothetical protein [Allomuricauda sp.]|tara:strand:+ start:1662 stop:2225 length:564 start_codon:yes stop_codon:yes gene_type:complete
MPQNATVIIERLMKLLNLQRSNELCALLGIKHNTLSGWKKRNTLDFNKVLKLCEDHRLDLEYVFYGNNVPPQNSPKHVNKVVEEDVHKPFSLINTNRNLALFSPTKNCMLPSFKGCITIGQLLKKSHLKPGVPYVVMITDSNYLIDEIGSFGSRDFQLKNSGIIVNLQGNPKVYEIICSYPVDKPNN